MTTQHLAPRRRTRRIVIAGIAASVVGLAGVGYAASDGADSTTTTALEQTLSRPDFGSVSPPTTGGTDPSIPTVPAIPTDPTSPSDRSGTTETTDTTDATDEQEEGLVYITSTIDYGTGQGAGTGMILTSDGQILTNHHVVEGATSLSVEVVSTGQTYDADVIGYDSTHDVAVLQLQDASGLTPVTTDISGDVQVGDAVTGVGNANGDGGAASAAAGTVIALDQSITVSSETGGEASRLTGLIEVDADIIAGDSGGALYDEDGEVVGMNTAASSGTANITGYAVPIAQALEIVDQIESGAESDTVQIGNHGYLGVQLSSQVTGAYVAGVVDDSAAAEAGITTGSTITSLNGNAISTADALSEAVSALDVGERVNIAWTDASGTAHTETITLGEGPIG